MRVVSFRLKSLSPKGEKAIRKYDVKDRRVLVSKISDNPLIISFVWKGRFSKFINDSSIKSFIGLTMKSKGCKENIDYELEVKE